MTLTSCKKDNSAFVGTYTGFTTVNGGTASSDTYKVTAGSGSKDVNISEVPQPGLNVTGTVNGTALTIPSQSAVISGFTGSISGSGTLAGNTITMTGTFVTGTTSFLIVFTGTK